MHTETQRSIYSLEVVKWLVVMILLVLAIIGNYYYRNSYFILRVLVVIVMITIAGSVAMLTSKGKSTIALVREARIEVRKVVWATRHEVLHTTLIVTAVTAVMSLILWGLDGILIYMVSFITSLRF